MYVHLFKYNAKGEAWPLAIASTRLLYTFSLIYFEGGEYGKDTR
jgi:hypothetical protein